MNNTINFSLTESSFCIVFLFDKSVLPPFEKKRNLSNCNILSNHVVIPLSSGSAAITDIKVSSRVNVKVKKWIILTDVTIQDSITIDGNSTKANIQGCVIKNIAKITLNTSSGITNTEFIASGYSDGTLILESGLRACLVNVYFRTTDLSYTVQATGDNVTIDNKLIWGNLDDLGEPIIKVLDPFTLAT